MQKLQKTLSANKFKVHSLAFLLILLPSALLYPAAQADSPGWIGFLLGLVIAGNLLALLTR